MSRTAPHTDQLIEQTLQLTDEGIYDSISQATRVTGAPRSTVYHRRAGRPPRSQINVRSTRLTLKQEAIFTRWITDLQLQYQPVNYTQLTKIAEKLAHQNDPSRPLGKNWVSRFVQRSKILSHGRSQLLSKDRISSIIPNQIEG